MPNYHDQSVRHLHFLKVRLRTVWTEIDLLVLLWRASVLSKSNKAFSLTVMMTVNLKISTKSEAVAGSQHFSM